MQLNLSRILTFSILFVIISCNRSSVSLTYTNAKGEIEPLQNLVFSFDKALAPDSLVNVWDSVPYINFTPAIPGRFRWQKPDKLVFSPAIAFKPATEYTAELSSELTVHIRGLKVSDQKALNFHTALLAIENSFGRWIPASQGSTQAVAEIDLFFNYPVDPKQLTEALHISIDGKEEHYQLRSVSVANRQTIRLMDMKPVDKDLATLIRIDKTFKPEGGTLQSADDLTIESTLGSPYNLTVNEITSDHDGNRASIYVRTSQQVSVGDLASKISFDPVAKFSVTASDDGFVITSDAMNAEKSYLLNFSNGIRGTIGGVLREDRSEQVAFGEIEPSLSFGNSRSVYLSSRGNEFIELKVTNIPKIRVIVSKIYESNLMAATRYGYYPADKANNEEEYYDEEPGTADYAAGDIVYEKDVETTTLPKYGKSRLFKFNIEDHLPDFKGIYHIKVRSATDYWVSDSRFVSKTDIGIVAREGASNMVVFANSLRTASPLEGVNMSLYGANNQLLGIGTTNKDGFAEISYSRTSPSGFKPAMIIAKSPDDFNYLPLNTSMINTSRFDVGGKSSNAAGMDAFIFEERDIYRPGETIHYATILRDARWNSPGAVPVVFRFLLPTGKEYNVTRKTLNEQGATEGSLILLNTALTGTYTLEVYSGNQVLLGSRSYSVEEFVPDRLKLTTSATKTSVKPGESVNMTVHADNFFGPPAVGRKYESEIQVRAVPFHPKGFSDFNFDLQSTSVTFDKKITEGTTNEQGEASVTFAAPDIYRNMGMLVAKNYFTVFDETGRPVSRSITTPIITQDVFFGIQSDGYGYFPLNQQVRFPIVALSSNEKLLQNAKATVQVIRHEYRTVLTKSGSYFRYDSQRDDKIVAEQEMVINGSSTSFPFVPRKPGEYELKVFLAGSSSYVSRSFYSYGSWGDNNSFEVNNEGQVDIEADRTAYAAGESAKLLFKTPFNGQLLVTVERDDLKSYKYLEVKNRSASMELPLTEAFLPNVYITATLIKPHQLSDIPLTVAHGFKSLKVEMKDRKLPVAITASPTSRSRTRQTVQVKTSPGSYVTLAVVDNGVLQVTDFKTPDPYNFFYAKKSLEVKPYDLYPLLFPELRATLSSTGGDGETDVSKRTNPMPAKRVKIASYWSGIQKANGSGVASFQVDVPAFSGELRIMAVSFNDDSFGSADATMKVADPIVISMAAPRFASPGDTVEVSAVITNTTPSTLAVNASLQTEGPFKVTSAPTSSLSLGAAKEAKLIFRIASAPLIGTGALHLKLRAGTYSVQEDIAMSNRPAVPNLVRRGSGVINGSGKTSLTIPINQFLPGSGSYQLVIGRSPIADLGSQLKYLVEYPHGCTEQVVSAAFPQLYLPDLAASYHVNGIQGSNSSINEAVRIIRMRQLYNGGLTLWESGAEHWWASIYAAHFLLEARKAGYDVDDRLVNGLLQFINSKLRKRETITYYYNRDQQRKIAPKEVAYSLYVLSLAGRSNLPVMNYYKTNTALLSLDSRYLLSAAFALGGDKKSFSQLLPSAFNGEVSVAETGGSFYSDIRDEAIALDVLLNVDPANKQVPDMVKHVADKLEQRRWYTTQEASFSLLALGKFARLNAGATVTADVLANGKRVGSVSDKSMRFTARQLGSNQLAIQSNGTGKLYYSWQAEGVTTDGSFVQEDQSIKARRRFFTRTGSLINSNQFTQNQLVIVELSVEKTYSGDIRNIVATDLLPAGFEIENPRTKEIPGMDWIKNASEPFSLDVRDDRINFFFDLDRPKQVYYYAVRAVTPGVYKLGPVSAEAMYNGDYHSYNGQGQVIIR